MNISKIAYYLAGVVIVVTIAILLTWPEVAGMETLFLCLLALILGTIAVKDKYD